MRGEHSREGAAAEFSRQLREKEQNKENAENIEKALRVVEKVVEWAQNNGIEISHLKKLGGGFVNLVLLVETPEGKSYVVKAFADAKGAQTTRDAQKTLDKVAGQDRSFISEAVGWIDDSTFVTSKAEGFPIKKLFDAVSDTEDGINQACRGFSDLGKTLGNIHERTERVLMPNDPDVYRTDLAKVMNQLRGYVERGLLPFTSEELGMLEKKISRFTQDGVVSVIHGDAHLDQFFCAPDQSVITIVDYDTVHEGDPMADVGRALASIRDFGQKSDISEQQLRKIEMAFLQGYRTVRHENLPLSKSEFDQPRIIVYELRLSMVQLWQFNDLLEKIRPFIPKGMPDGEFLKTTIRENAEIRSEINASLPKEEQERLDRYLLVLDRLNEILTHLQGIELEEVN